MESGMHFVLSLDWRPIIHHFGGNDFSHRLGNVGFGLKYRR